MAIFRASSIISGISGRLGGVVFARARGANVIRHRPASPGGRSPNHEAAAQRLTQLQRLWRTLTVDQHTAWRTYAVGFPTTNRLGVSRSLSGYQAFIRFNFRSLQHDDGTHTTPHSTHETAIPSRADALPATPALFGYKIEPTTIPPATDYNVLLYGATLQSTTQPTGYTNWRFLGLHNTDGGSIDNIATLWNAVWPPAQSGQYVGIRTDVYSSIFRLSSSIVSIAISP